MANYIQRVANWLLGDYPVATTEVGSGTSRKLIQHVHLVDSSDAAVSVGGGTQYTEGDTDASITGTAILWEDGSDTLRPVSASKPLPISGTLTTTSGSIAGDGRKVVTTAGTAVAIASTTAAAKVIITACTDNTDLVTVGASTVVAALATRRGIPLAPGQSVEIGCTDLADVFIDSLVNGEGVTFLYEA